MHYDSKLIAKMAKPLGEGWSETVLTLEKGDTAFTGASTKYYWQGPGKVTYLMHPTGWEETPGRGVTRKPIGKDE